MNKELQQLAAKYANLSHEEFDGNIDLHYQNGFIAGYAAARTSPEVGRSFPQTQIQKVINGLCELKAAGLWKEFKEENKTLLNELQTLINEQGVATTTLVLYPKTKQLK
jgi:hypothetical protein